jgi:hypothetical protein
MLDLETYLKDVVLMAKMKNVYILGVTHTLQKNVWKVLNR